jgi:hypothetical protein
MRGIVCLANKDESSKQILKVSSLVYLKLDIIFIVITLHHPLVTILVTVEDPLVYWLRYKYSNISELLYFDWYYMVKRTYRLCMEDLINTSHLRASWFWYYKNLILRIYRGCLPTLAGIRDISIHCPSNVWFVMIIFKITCIYHYYYTAPCLSKFGIWVVGAISMKRCHNK